MGETVSFHLPRPVEHGLERKIGEMRAIFPLKWCILPGRMSIRFAAALCLCFYLHLFYFRFIASFRER